MTPEFYKYIDEIDQSIDPIKVAWYQALNHLELNNILSKEFEHALFKEIEQLSNDNFYHNAYHFGHVIIGCAYLMKYEINNPTILPQNAIPLLLAALFHDSQHPGRGNIYPYELEEKSSSFFNQYSIENNLEQLWDKQELINYHLPTWKNISLIVNELIISTEFQQAVNKVVQDYKNNPNENFNDSNNNEIKINTLKMLLIESDILLSCLDETGIKQTEKILAEHNLQLTKSEVKDKWIGFLKLVSDTHYQSQASSYFNIKEEIYSIIAENKVKSPHKPK